MDPKVTISLDEPVATINPNIYGHFMEHLGECIYGGTWVGEDSSIPNAGGIRTDVVEALRAVRAPIIRWPGGCFADDYHWRDGIGPRAERPRRINIHWGDVVEANQFGTHEFAAFCRAVGAEPYICGNVGSGSPREMRDWVEYCNYPAGTTLSDERARNGSPEPLGIRYWSVGNENWGCGGSFTPETYATEYRRFATYLRSWGGASLFLVGCGPCGNDASWTRRFFEAYRDGWSPAIHGWAAHYYCGTAGTATEYTTEQWYELLWKACRMEELVVQQRALMDGLGLRGVGLIVDEWGAWHPPTPGRNPHFLWQQNTVRDALVAALTLDILNRHADKVVMANIAQTINVLQALLLTGEDKMVKTPTYHVYDLYAAHQGATAVTVRFDSPDVACRADGETHKLALVSGAASVRDAVLNVTLVNASADSAACVALDIRGGDVTGAPDVVALSYPEGDIRAHNTFDEPDVVGLDTRPSPARWDKIEVAPASVTRLSFPLR
jgi:alpha-N-arabinofuranosidase